MKLNRRSPAALFAVLAIGLGTTGVAYAAATGPSHRAVASETTMELGKALYVEGCASCHGLSGEGSEDSPTLVGVGAASVDFQVSTGRMPLATFGVQPASRKLIYSPEEIAALAAYVGSWGNGPAIPTEAQADPSAADLVLGGELFRTNCSQCHSVSGKGGALSSGNYAPSLMSTKNIQIYEAMLVGPANMPAFSDTQITPSEKQAIIRYIHELRSGPNPGGYSLGRLGPVTEGLFFWIVGLGGLLIVAVWIGAKAK